MFQLAVQEQQELGGVLLLAIQGTVSVSTGSSGTVGVSTGGSSG